MHHDCKTAYSAANHAIYVNSASAVITCQVYPVNIQKKIVAAVMRGCLCGVNWKLRRMLRCRLLSITDMRGYFHELRLNATTKAGLDEFLSAVISTFTGIVKLRLQ